MVKDSTDAVLLGNILVINTMDRSHARNAFASSIDHDPIAVHGSLGIENGAGDCD